MTIERFTIERFTVFIIALSNLSAHLQLCKLRRRLDTIQDIVTIALDPQTTKGKNQMTMEQAKIRALNYLDSGNLTNALASFTGDLKGYGLATPMSDSLLGTLGTQAVMNGDAAALRKLIEGFA